jgi:DNA-binding PadR family transcriptional regulator
MRHSHRGGSDRHHQARSHHHHSHHRHGSRLFDYGELRLLLLAMIAERPRHGYELIKSIEERFAGSYTPSPGVIYPTLAWLDDMGYAAIDTVGEGAGRKIYRITPEGEAFLAANRAAVGEILSRASGQDGAGHEVPSGVLRAMENLKTAMRLRFRKGPIGRDAADSIASALDEAARTVEQS